MVLLGCKGKVHCHDWCTIWGSNHIITNSHTAQCSGIDYLRILYFWSLLFLLWSFHCSGENISQIKCIVSLDDIINISFTFLWCATTSTKSFCSYHITVVGGLVQAKHWILQNFSKCYAKRKWKSTNGETHIYQPLLLTFQCPMLRINH